MKEIWKDIPGYKGYQISNFGNVRSLPRNTNNQYNKGLIKKPNIHHGYCRMQLISDGVKKWFFVHRLVAEEFIPNPNNLPQVNHIDGNKQNNNVNNLEWCSSQENINHALKNNLFKATRVIQYDKQRNYIKTWDSIIKASRTLNIHKNGIQDCCKGRKKTAGGYIWRYADK